MYDRLNTKQDVQQVKIRNKLFSDASGYIDLRIQTSPPTRRKFVSFKEVAMSSYQFYFVFALTPTLCASFWLLQSF